MLSSLGMFVTNERSRTRQFHYERLINDFTPILNKKKHFLCKINIFFSGDIVCTCAELLAADLLIFALSVKNRNKWMMKLRLGWKLQGDKAWASTKIIQFYIAVSWACKSFLQTVSLSEYPVKDVVMCSKDKIIKNGSGLRFLWLIEFN